MSDFLSQSNINLWYWKFIAILWSFEELINFNDVVCFLLFLTYQFADGDSLASIAQLWCLLWLHLIVKVRHFTIRKDRVVSLTAFFELKIYNFDFRTIIPSRFVRFEKWSCWNICLFYLLIADSIQFLWLAERYFTATKDKDVIINFTACKVVQPTDLILTQVKDGPFKINHIQYVVLRHVISWIQRFTI